MLSSVLCTRVMKDQSIRGRWSIATEDNKNCIYIEGNNNKRKEGCWRDQSAGNAWMAKISRWNMLTALAIYLIAYVYWVWYWRGSCGHRARKREERAVKKAKKKHARNGGRWCDALCIMFICAGAPKTLCWYLMLLRRHTDPTGNACISTSICFRN